MSVMKGAIRTLRLLLVVAGLALAVRAASAAEEKSLLASDGTLYVARADTALNLGASGDSIQPTDNLIEFSFQRQDGSHGLGIVPGTIGASAKSNLDMAYDEASGSLVLLWKEDFLVVNMLHLEVYRNGAWTQADLLPSLGFTHAYNPQMLLYHQTVHTQDANGNDVAQLQSILSVIWWEESYDTLARYAPIFLNEDFRSSDATIYNLPALIGTSAAPVSYATRPPAGAYMYPALQLEGPGGGILASFADLTGGRQYVIRIGFPNNLGRPDDPNNITWQRRRIPVVGVASGGPLSVSGPLDVAVTTFVGPAYNPTLVWRGDNAVFFTRLEGQSWSSVKSVPLSDVMTYEKAMRLVQEMATKN